MKRILTLVLAMLLVFGCVSASAELIGVSFDDLNTEFWMANIEGIRSKAKELGVELIEVIANGDANKQNEQISDLIARGCKVIICAAADGSAIEVAVEECQDAGVAIIMDNRPVQGATEPAAQVLSDNEAMAFEEMSWLIGYAQAQGITFNNAIMLIGDLGDENAVQRKAGFVRAMEATPGVVNVVVEIPTEWNQEMALAGLQNALQAYPNADLIITPSDFLWTPIQSALEQAGKWGKIGEANHVPVISFDGDVNGMQMMKDGYNWANAAQAAIGQGEMCVEVAMKLLAGEALEEKIIADAGVIATLENLDEVKDLVWGWASVK